MPINFLSDLTSPSFVTPILGTPSSGTLTSCVGLPIVNGTTGTLSVARGGTGVITSTGTGNNVLSASPTFTGNVTFTGLAYQPYHAVSTGQYFFDSYNGDRNLRWYVQGAYSDIIRNQPYTATEYWDGSAWVAWTAPSLFNAMLDGQRNTGTSSNKTGTNGITNTTKKFRFEVTASTGWPTQAIFWVETSWAGFSYPGLTAQIEEFNTTTNTWTTPITTTFTTANSVTDWGLAGFVTWGLHNGYSKTRITLEFGTIPTTGNYTSVDIRNIMITSNYAGTSNILPFSTDYYKNVTFGGSLTVPGSVKLNNLTASQTLELDASKNIISAAKQTGYNLALSTTATDIKVNGTQSLGSLSTLARADHVHPIDTSRAPTASPTFTGTLSTSRITSSNTTDTPDIIGNIPFIRKHDNVGDYLSSINNLETFILSKTDGQYGGGTKPSGSHNGFGVISLQTHTSNYYTQIGLDTNQNKLWLRSANATTSYGSWSALASESYVTTAVSNLVSSAPAALDTLNELAAALGDDANFSTTVTNSIATKAPLASPSFTGNVGIGTASPVGKLEVQTVDANRYIRFKAPNGEERFQFYTGGTGNYSSQFMYDADGTTRNVQIAAGGTSYFNGGNVGIGTTSPGYKLSVAGTIQSNAGTITGYPLLEQLRMMYDQDGNYWKFETTAGPGADLLISQNATPFLVVKSGTGRVGIGTTAPSEKLDVVGNIRVQNHGEIYADGTGDLFLGNTNSGHLKVGGNPNDTIISPSFNNLVVQTSRDQDDIIFKGGDSISEIMRIDTSAGNVGIGTASPTELLTINKAATTGKWSSFLVGGAEKGRINWNNTHSIFEFSTPGVRMDFNSGSGQMFFTQWINILPICYIN
jgi:hypothetical protein